MDDNIGSDLGGTVMRMFRTEGIGHGKLSPEVDSRDRAHFVSLQFLSV